MNKMQNIVKELLKYELSDAEIILRLSSNECTIDEINNTIVKVKQIIADEKSCARKQYSQQYYKANKVEIKKKQKIWDANNKETIRKSTRKHTVKKYGLTLEQYEVLFHSQQGKCAIRHQTELKQSLCVDHCHEINNVRGLLCIRCNRAIGMLEDNVQLLMNAIDYLNTKL
jgi:hypothetical protein